MHFLSQFLFAFLGVVFCIDSVVVRSIYSVESVISFVVSVFIISNENSSLEIMKSGDFVSGF